MAFSPVKKRKAGRLAAAMVAAGLSLGLSGAALAQTPAAGPAKAAAEVVKPAGTVDQALLLRPSALKDMSEGDVNAPITLIEYASLTCSHCADFYINTMPALRADYIKTGKVHYILRELPTDPRSMAAAMLTRCVGQDKFFPFVQLLFEKQEDWAFAQDGKTPLMCYAKMAGLDDKQFEACLSEKNETVFKALSKVSDSKDSDSDMMKFDIRVTPTLFINGAKYQGALTPEQLAPILDKILAEKGSAKK